VDKYRDYQKRAKGFLRALRWRPAPAPARSSRGTRALARADHPPFGLSGTVAAPHRIPRRGLASSKVQHWNGFVALGGQHPRTVIRAFSNARLRPSWLLRRAGHASLTRLWQRRPSNRPCDPVRRRRGLSRHRDQLPVQPRRNDQDHLGELVDVSRAFGGHLGVPHGRGDFITTACQPVKS
jgi:hypothetical protein